MISLITPTHNVKYLHELWDSIKRQTNADWEWVLVPNGGAVIPTDIASDRRVRIVPYNGENRNIGAIKLFAFLQGRGDWLVEVDHDDLLTADCLEELKGADDGTVGFLYSDCADFSPTGAPVTYHDASVRKAWESNGWKFRTVTIDGKGYLSPESWEPSAQALSLVYYAPNHVRAWSREVYDMIGGHNPDLAICDDHELLIRTYTVTKMRRIPKVLYLYRVETNTWATRADEIRSLTFGLRDKYLHGLVTKECDERGLPMYDLGGRFGCPKGWKSVDLKDADVLADLNGRWPFEDGSVGAFRAFDFLEHLPDKRHSMSEIHRCLAPGGWLLSATPSALGQGAYQDPTHVSYWVPNSFRYYTEKRFAKYIDNASERFMEGRILQTNNEIPYVVADLLCLKGDMSHIPGERLL